MRQTYPQDTMTKYNKRVKEWIAGKCCAKCGKPATENHHSRGKLGELLMDEQFWIPMCRPCHRWVHDNIAKARKTKLICDKGLWNMSQKEFSRKHASH